MGEALAFGVEKDNAHNNGNVCRVCWLEVDNPEFSEDVPR